MSSGFSYPQPIFTSPIYNPAFYLSLDASGYLTYDYAQTLYLDKNDYRMTYITGITPGTATQGIALVPGTNNDVSGIGALSCSSLTVGGQPVVAPPSYVVGITPGTAVNNKALVLGASGEIATITSLTATDIYGSIKTAAQSSITSLGTLTGLTIDGNLMFSGAARYITGLSSISATTITGAVSGSQTGITAVGTLSSLTVSGSINGMIATAAQTGITSLGTLSSLTVSGTTDCETLAGTAFSPTTRTSDYNLIISNQSDITGSTSAICFANDDSAYNTYTPSVALIATRVATSIQYAASDFDIQLRSNTNILSPMVSRLMIKRAGGIGIGTTSPSGSVSIIGNSSYTAGGWRRIMYLSNDSTTPITAEIQIVSADSGTSPANGLWIGTISDDPVKIGCGNTSVMYINTSNRVAINLSASTWSPEADLHVNGMIWSNQYFHTKQNVDGKAVYRTNWSQSNFLAWGTDATVGAMRLGVCDANFNWVSYAPCRGGAYTNASDRRIKKDIIDIPYGLAEVLQMQPRKFAMRNDQSQHVGFIAQEILEIIPECISGVESPNDELNDQGEPINPMGIDLSSLVSVLCKAIQEQDVVITSNREQINELRSTIAALK
jgi:hypothetical protein